MSLPTMRAYGQFVAAAVPVALNLDMGFVPDYFVMMAEQAGAADIVQVEWFKTAGDGKCMRTAGAGTKAFMAAGGVASWQPAGSSVVPARWAAATAYTVGQVVHPVGLTSTGVAPGAQNMPLFQCTTAGTSGANEPTWTAAIGGTVVDGTAVWTQIDPKTQGAAESKMMTGPYGTNTDGTTSTPAKTGLGVTIPAAIQTPSATYDWYAEGRVPSP